jgi:hypothetical protein
MRERIGQLIAALGLCVSLAACDGASQDAASDGDEKVTTDYGVDGNETVNGVSFVSAKSMFDRFARGEAFCSDFVFADNSCTYVSYAGAVRKDSMTMNGYRIEPGLTTKQHYPFELSLKGKFLCSTFREEDLENWTLVVAGDRRPQISNKDGTFDKQRQDQWRDSNKRSMAKDFGLESCYRYSAVMKNGVPEPGQYRQYEYIDGIQQPRRQDRIYSMFKGNELEFLILRPDTED